MSQPEKSSLLKNKRRPRCSEAEQQRWVSQWRNSGLTKQAFCTRHDLNAKSLGRWAAKFAAVKSSASFARVKTPSSPSQQPSPSGFVQLRTARGYQLQIAVGTSTDYVAALLKSLEG